MQKSFTLSFILGVMMVSVVDSVPEPLPVFLVKRASKSIIQMKKADQDIQSSLKTEVVPINDGGLTTISNFDETVGSKTKMEVPAQAKMLAEISKGLNVERNKPKNILVIAEMMSKIPVISKSDDTVKPEIKKEDEESSRISIGNSENMDFETSARAKKPNIEDNNTKNSKHQDQADKFMKKGLTSIEALQNKTYFKNKKWDRLTYLDLRQQLDSLIDVLLDSLMGARLQAIQKYRRSPNVFDGSRLDYGYPRYSRLCITLSSCDI